MAAEPNPATVPLSDPQAIVRWHTTRCRSTSISNTRAGKSSGKTNHFAVYLICGLFDTSENRVITSGLALASILEASLRFPAMQEEP
jgi:hypothetical protein